MLTLLNPEEIEYGKKTEADKTQRRLIGLAEEETRLVRSVNSLRLQETDVVKRIDYLKSVDEGTLNTRKGILLGEVEELERRRSVALQPVVELMDQARKYLDQNKADVERLEKKEKELVAFANKLSDRGEDVVELEDDLADRKKQMEFNFSRRETALVAAETEVARQTKKLSADWVDYHSAVAAMNETMAQRERAMIDGERANLIVREGLAKREAELNDRERAINDKYNTFQQAVEELEKKKHGNHKTGRQ